MDRVDYSKKVFLQPKLDGVRCLFTKDGAFTRRGNQFKNVAHLETQLADFFELYPTVVLDGELYNHDLKNDFEKIVSLVRKTVNISCEDKEESAEKVQYHIYDMIDTTASYKARFTALQSIPEVFNTTSVFITPTFDIHKEEEVYNLHEEFKAQGYEGSMIRLNGAYENKRSYNLIKVKDFVDFEAVVIGFVEGKGKLQGKLGKFVMKRLDTGKEFGAPASAHTHAQRQELWENRNKYLNTEWTVCAFEFTKTGAPRFPVLKSQRNYE